MPDFAMHHLFRELLNPPQPARDYPALYNWGLHGPDLLFYRKAVSAAPHRALGIRMHKESTSQLLQSMASYCRSLTDETHDMACAYMYGFAAHYALDSTIHPYVNSCKSVIQERRPELSPDSVHALIETDMDTDYHRMVTGRSISEFKPFSEYQMSEKEQRSLGALYTHLLYNVYSVLLSPREVIASAKDALSVQRLLYSDSALLMQTAKLLDRSKGKGSRFFSAHIKGKQPQWDSLNLDNTPWADPYSLSERTESVPELVEMARERYRSLVSVMERNAGGALLAISVNTDFAGKPII